MYQAVSETVNFLCVLFYVIYVHVPHSLLLISYMRIVYAHNNDMAVQVENVNCVFPSHLRVQNAISLNLH